MRNHIERCDTGVLTNMRTIPLIYSVIEERKLYAGKPALCSGKISVSDLVPAVGLDALKSKKERGKVFVADAISLSKRTFNPSFMEYCKTPGNELWVIESLNRADDVFDAFLGNADKVVFPCGDVRSSSEFGKILEISDNCIPLLMTGDARRKCADLEKEVSDLLSEGFVNIMVADLDGSVSDDKWDSLMDICGGLISYSPRRQIGDNARILAEDVFPLNVQ